MDLLVLFLLLIPLLSGILCLFWGVRRMRQYRWEVERDPTGASILLMLLGCLLVGLFFYPVLLAASDSLVVAADVVTVQSFLLIIWGETNLRTALISDQNARGAPWVIFWGALPLMIYPPIWMKLPELLTWLYIAAMLLILPVGQYLLIKLWIKRRKKQQLP